MDQVSLYIYKPRICRFLFLILGKIRSAMCLRLTNFIKLQENEKLEIYRYNPTIVCLVIKWQWNSFFSWWKSERFLLQNCFSPFPFQQCISLKPILTINIASILLSKIRINTHKHREKLHRINSRVQFADASHIINSHMPKQPLTLSINEVHHYQRKSKYRN